MLPPALSTTLWQFIAIYFLIGLGTSATFAPLMAEASHWFERYRGLAVTIVASGNYVGGTIWPPLVNWGVQSAGWRTTHIAIGIFCTVAMTIVPALLRVQIGSEKVRGSRERAAAAGRPADLDQYADGDAVHRQHFLLRGDVDAAGPHRRLLRRSRLRRGARRRDAVADDGVRVVSRIGSGFLADRIGGIRTLLIGSVAQGFALLFYLFFDGLTSLYLISAMFGLFQGGIVPSYAIIVRESMPARGSGDPRRHRDFRVRIRHVVRRLGVRRDLRRIRLLRGGVHERAGVECGERHHHGGAIDPGAAAARNGISRIVNAKP